MTRLARWLVLIVLSTSLFGLPTITLAESRTIIISLFYRGTDADAEDAQKVLRDFAAEMNEQHSHSISTRIVNISEDSNSLERLNEVAEFFHIPARTPLVYACKQANYFYGKKSFEAYLKRMLTVRLFRSNHCDACNDIPAFKDDLNKRYPGLIVTIKNIDNSGAAWDEFDQIARRHGTNAHDASIPAYVFGSPGVMLLPYVEPGPKAMKYIDEVVKSTSEPIESPPEP
jgi:hypothetical protein